MDAPERQRPISLEAMLSGALDPAPDEGAASVLVFEVAGARYAVDATRVEAIVATPPIAPLPHPPPSVLGVASVRGRMRLVVDPGGARVESSERLVVLHGDGQLALLAGQVLGVAPGAPPDATLVDPDALLNSER